MTIVALVMVILVMLVIGGRWTRRGRDYKGKRMQAEALRRTEMTFAKRSIANGPRRRNVRE